MGFSMTAFFEIVLVSLIALLAWRGQAIRERSPRGRLVTQHGEKVGTRRGVSLKDKWPDIKSGVKCAAAWKAVRVVDIVATPRFRPFDSPCLRRQDTFPPPNMVAWTGVIDLLGNNLQPSVVK